MPSKTAKQARYMAMCAHTPKKGCPTQSVAKEFNKADKGTGILKSKKKTKSKSTKKVKPR